MTAVNRMFRPISILALGLSACGGAASLAPTDEQAAETTTVVAAATEAGGDFVVNFRDRAINLEPYVQGFPYSGFQLSAADGYALWFHTDAAGQHLMTEEIAFIDELDPTQGRRLGSIDWATRSWWGAEYVPALGTYFVWSDEANEERMNVYSLSPETGELSQLTHNDYTYGFAVSLDGSTFAYVARNGEGEPYNSCLHVRDLRSGSDREVLCDEGGDDRFTWTGVLFAPDKNSVIVSIQHDGDRNRGNFARIDLQADEPSIELLLPRAALNYSLWAVEHSWIGDSFYYVSSETGFDELYSFDLASGTSTQLTQFGEEISSLEFVPGDQNLVLLTRKRPHETELTMVAALTGEVVYSEVLPYAASIYDAWGDTAYLRATSVGSPFEIVRLRWGSIDGTILVAQEPFAGLPAALRSQIVHCETTRVSIPTFDTLPDGSQRTLHAFYSAPRNPPADDADRLVRIVSFYGGENGFSTGTQILCEAGIATLSPAPRGSSGFGSEFAALNDGDLGGDEIIDLFYAARWLEGEFGYEPHQIGVAGGSHGGYATMRALTFPPETNGRNESYRFGFGLSHAGFSDIADFWAACNIPDWVVLEAGDPTTEADKLRERSPLTHAARLEAPLLLTHGTNDQRVPIEGSRDFAAAAREFEAPVTYVEFEGQGHGIEGLENTLVYYRAVFSFLDSVLPYWRSR
jgi:dipeptidyl aminopeptidase/acylaminoacyl peptidase